MDCRRSSSDAPADDQAGSELSAERHYIERAKLEPRYFEFFYVKYKVPIFRYIYRKTFNPEVAEDLTANTFASALENLWQFQWQGHPLSAWLYQIARNEIKKFLLREKQLGPQARTEAAAELVDPHLGYLADAIRTEDHKALYECLCRLEKINQDIIVLHYWKGLTTGEIAGVLDLPEGTVKSKLKRERYKLNTMLRQLAEQETGDTATTAVESAATDRDTSSVQPSRLLKNRMLD